MLNIKIEKGLGISIYKQIVRQVVEAVEIGMLIPGDRLPTERELYNSTKIARGTIQKAYKELEGKGIIETIKGSGSFVSKGKQISPGDSKETAIYFIDELLGKLFNLDFKAKEIGSIFKSRLLEMENQRNNVRIAVIDCNPEALEFFKVQISSMKNIDIRMFIIDEILKYSKPDKVFENYDIIITTNTHYAQISKILYTLKQKLFKVVVSPDTDTIIKIATIPENSKVGLIVKSMKFKDIILKHIDSLSTGKREVEYAFEADKDIINRFLVEKDILILSQLLVVNDEILQRQLQNFTDKGGKVVEFKYQIEQGSLIYIEEQIVITDRSR